jgi:glycerol uptake facilitator-like aquaporin
MDLRLPEGIIAKFLMECLGCMMFHFVGSVSPTPLANSMILLVLVYFTAKVSGAHLNPAISLTFTALGHTHPYEMLVYWAAQISGCILGALWIACLVPGLYIHDSQAQATEASREMAFFDGCFRPNAGLSNMAIFGWEALSTFNFILPIFAVVWYTQNKDGYGNTGPLIVGFSLFANALACGHWTGAALNPARVLGSPAVFNCGNQSKLLYYITGELAGALAAVAAIIPWYGISINAWYIKKVPENVKSKMILFHSRSEKLRSSDQGNTTQNRLETSLTFTPNRSSGDAV